MRDCSVLVPYDFHIRISLIQLCFTVIPSLILRDIKSNTTLKLIVIFTVGVEEKVVFCDFFMRTDRRFLFSRYNSSKKSYFE